MHIYTNVKTICTAANMYLRCYYTHVFAVVHFVLTYVYMLGGNWA